MTVLYDILTGSKTAGGNWTLVSGPGTPPAPPVAHDDAVDFSAADDGTYVYRYTVSLEGGCPGDSAEVTVIVGQFNFISNDECDNYVNINTHFTLSSTLPLPEGTTLVEANELFTAGCEKDVATASAAPAEPWATATDGDIWFRISLPTIAPAADYNFTVEVDSTLYGLTGLQDAQLALYTGADCDTMTLLDQTEGTGATTSLTAFTTGSPAYCFVRIGAKNGNEGNFDLNITT